MDSLHNPFGGFIHLVAMQHVVRIFHYEPLAWFYQFDGSFQDGEPVRELRKE